MTILATRDRVKPDWSVLDDPEVRGLAREVSRVVAKKYRKYRFDINDLLQEAYVILATKLADRVRAEGARGLAMPLRRDLVNLLQPEIRRQENTVPYGLDPEVLGQLGRHPSGAVLVITGPPDIDDEEGEWS